jgi:hypothetical protein
MLLNALRRRSAKFEWVIEGRLAHPAGIQAETSRSHGIGKSFNDFLVYSINLHILQIAILITTGCRSTIPAL